MKKRDLIDFVDFPVMSMRGWLNIFENKRGDGGQIFNLDVDFVETEGESR